jgi:hypothetical protein
MSETQVADTILTQLGKSIRNISMFIGGHSFVAAKDGVTFRFKARAKNSANAVRITLDPSDTYKVEFLSLRGASVKDKGTFDNIYAEDLRPLFSRETELYLTF